MASNNHSEAGSVTPTIKELEVGMIGRLFGDNKHAAFNVAGVLSFLLFGLWVAVAYFPVVGLPPATVGTLLGLTIGYMFGDRRR